VTRRRQLRSARTRKPPPATSTEADRPIADDGDDSEPRPETALDWLVWLALWPIVTVAWLVAVPFVLLYVAVGFTIEALFGIRLRRRNDSDGSDRPG
jgi:hypothetical protein